MTSRVTREVITRVRAEHIVAHLRVRDRREIFALRWNDSHEDLVDDIMRAAITPLWSAWCLDGEPVAINGAAFARPGSFILAGFGTELWPKIVRPLTRDAFDRVLPGMVAGRAHRAEAYVLAENQDSLRWIECLGGEREGLLRGYGRREEDFLLYGWRLKDVLRRRQITQHSHTDLHHLNGTAGDGRPWHPAGHD